MKTIKNAIRSLYRVKFTTAFLISIVPIFIVIGYLSSGLGEFYRHIGVDNPRALDSDQYRFHMRSALVKAINKLTSPSPPNDSTLETFNIFVDKKYLLELDSNLPSSGKSQYYKAFLKIGSTGENYDIELRYRGDNTFHWFYKQKSLRIKYKKSKFYNLERKFNLINPPLMLGVLECINYQMARLANVISPDCFPARVFINGEYFGVYIYVSQVEESTLRKHKRMPGSIYFGDNGKPDKNGVSDLWSNPEHWIKSAARNAEQEASREDINYLIEAVSRKDDASFYRFFNKMVNKDAYYSFLAWDVFFGSDHHDYNHNHKIYFDPYLGKFEPIAWDLRRWAVGKKKDLSIYPLLNRIKLNPILEHERDLHLYNLMHSGEFKLSSVIGRIERLVDDVLADLEADKNRDSRYFMPQVFNGFVSRPYLMVEFNSKLKYALDGLRKRNRNITNVQEDATFNYSFKTISAGHYNLAFSVAGNSAIYIDLPDILSKEVKIYRDLNFNGILDQGDAALDLQESTNTLLYPGRKRQFHGTENPESFNWPRFLLGTFDLLPAPLTYSYIIETNDFLPEPKLIKARNAITGATVNGVEANVSLQSDAESIHPWLLSPQPMKTVLLRGNIQVIEDLEFSERTHVTIAPGTTFEINPEKNLYFYGKVTALGRKDAPIVFKRGSADEAWGAIVIQGKATSGSVFDYVNISGGSITEKNLIKYTAQFNIHDANNITVKNCTIGENSVGDDSMHIAYSHVTVDGCLFYGARSDALDIDIATVTVSNSLFVNSGNDALDLMTTSAVVRNSIFLNSGDKGISTGEWSTGLYENNIFMGNLIGIEIKDKSVVDLSGGVFIDNTGWDINLYRKNKRYDRGGELTAKSIYTPDSVKVSTDDLSRYTLQQVITNHPADLGEINPFVARGALTDWSKTKGALQKLVDQYD